MKICRIDNYDVRVLDAIQDGTLPLLAIPTNSEDPIGSGDVLALQGPDRILICQVAGCLNGQTEAGRLAIQPGFAIVTLEVPDRATMDWAYLSIACAGLLPAPLQTEWEARHLPGPIVLLDN